MFRVFGFRGTQAPVFLGAWMTGIFQILGGFVVQWAIAGIASAEPKALEGLTMELVSEQSEIRAGERIYLGLAIAHSEGYHTYWKHPGIVGVPTGVEWEVPAGFKVGEIEWPAPLLTKMASYTVYGYEGKILLPISVDVPADWKPGQDAVLKAKASWMCCAETCNPGFAEFQIKLPVSAAKTPAFTKWKTDFDLARAQMPVRSEAWKVTASRSGMTVLVEVAAEEGSDPLVFEHLKDIYFFSGDGLIDSRGEQVVQRLGKAGLSFKLKVSEFEPKTDDGKPVGRLMGVLSSSHSWLKGQKALALAVDVPLNPAKKD